MRSKPVSGVRPWCGEIWSVVATWLRSLWRRCGLRCASQRHRSGTVGRGLPRAGKEHAVEKQDTASLSRCSCQHTLGIVSPWPLLSSLPLHWLIASGRTIDRGNTPPCSTIPRGNNSSSDLCILRIRYILPKDIPHSPSLSFVMYCEERKQKINILLKYYWIWQLVDTPHRVIFCVFFQIFQRSFYVPIKD